MRFLTSWIRDFVDDPVDDKQLAQDLTMAGLAIEAVEAAGGDTVLEADITTNRVDAMNHYGVAREVSVLYDRELKPYRAEPRESGSPAAEHAAVEIADPDLCSRYSARVIRGVKIAPSPAWMVRRLEAVGLRSINKVADITNYLLIELGHPLHAFDLDTLEGRQIIVRRARPRETMVTLDGVTRQFTTDDLVIADAKQAVAIAGVMGGAETGINLNTTNVLLESAWFQPLSVRRTAKRLGMHTDASHRFERGADLDITAIAADRAAELIQQVAGGEIRKGIIDPYPTPRQPARIILRASELKRILGSEIPEADVTRILRRLDFKITEGGDGRWTVLQPGWRLDVDREIDLIEEIARHYGYNRFPNTLPEWSGVAHRAPDAAAERALRETARGLGYSEAITYSLVSPRDNEQFAAAGRETVRLSNPLSEQVSVLRTSAVPGVLAAAEWNLNRGTRSVRLFEIGKVYERAGSAYQEPEILTLVATGQAGEASPHQPARELSFYDLKGDVEVLLDLFEQRNVYFDSAAGVDYYHPGRAARAAVDGRTVARFGQLHPRIQSERKLRQPVFVAEFFLDRLYPRGLRRPAYVALPRVPAVDRDLSLLVPEGVTFERVAETARGLRIAELGDLRPVEIFRGEQAGPGRYSLLLRLVFQRAEQTLSDAEVNQWSAAVAEALNRNLGIIQRT